MSGAQGAQAEGKFTPTTYESVPGGANKTRESLTSPKDAGGIEVKKAEEGEKLPQPPTQPAKQQDSGITGTG
ncbi:hypothetical protein SUGI_0273530 [Cryptomeria japonica]|uniref:uncharacterized protein LOC131045883 n=1 Tax=Cryptomeria japonica TaxID=3369 RepID=UPI002408D78E|nr:uncharacterized protein LOC131045883 [Cryptomeria japonica]GLJ16259.1 hypothetical protein SUGI_0273530 [Cryptomeria japonica]